MFYHHLNIYRNASDFSQKAKILDITDYLAFIGLALAYLAYCWNMEKDFASLKSILQSSLDEIEALKEWYEGQYPENTFKSPDAYLPNQKHLPITFFALPELVKRGLSEKEGVSERFNKNLSMFLERVASYNSYLEDHRLITTANPILSNKILNLLKPFKNDYNLIKAKVDELKSSNPKLYAIADECFTIKKIMHERLIGTINDKFGLHFLYISVRDDLKNIISNLDERKLFIIKYKWYIFILSTLIFLFIKLFFNLVSY